MRRSARTLTSVELPNCDKCHRNTENRTFLLISGPSLAELEADTENTDQPGAWHFLVSQEFIKVVSLDPFDLAGRNGPNTVGITDFGEHFGNTENLMRISVAHQYVFVLLCVGNQHCPSFAKNADR